MTTFNTGNPLGSTAVKDLYDNAQNLDVAVNDQEHDTWVDRFGKVRPTLSGQERSFDSFMDTSGSQFAGFMDASSDAFQQFLLSSGYQDLGDYGPGLEITERNQIFWRDGELYRASADLVLPYTTTGDWETEGGSFVSVGDAALRQQLAQPGGGEMVAFQQAGTGAVTRTTQDKMREWVSVLDYVKQSDGDDIFPAMIRANAMGVPVRVPAGQYTMIVNEPIVIPEGGGFFCEPNGAVITLAPESSAPYLFDMRTPRAHLIGLSFEGTPGVPRAVNYASDAGDRHIKFLFNRFASFSEGIVMSTSGSNTGGSTQIAYNRFNQVRKPVVNLNGGVNVEVVNNYMLGIDVGIDLSYTEQQPEGWIIQSNTILPNRAGAIGVRVAGGLAISILDNMIDQVGSGGTGILLDADSTPHRKCESIRTRNRWIGTASGGAMYGIRAVGDVRYLVVEDDSIVGFDENISLESRGAGKIIIGPYIGPRVLRPAAGRPSVDVRIDGATGVVYGPFRAQSATSVIETNTTVSNNLGFDASGSVQRSAQSSPVNTYIYYVGATKTEAGAGIGTGVFISSTVFRVFVPHVPQARRAGVGISISNVADFVVRHGSGTADVSDINFIGNTEAGTTLDVTIAGTLVAGSSAVLQFRTGAAAGWLAVR